MARTPHSEIPLTHRILVVDDDPHIREVIRVALRKAGMSVIEARDGKDALARFAGERPDLIVLDIGMPEFDGLDVCREIRKSSDVPILFLSARDEEIDRVLGLEIGGDDYVTKPFSPRELVARINALSRRPALGETGTQLRAGDIEMDLLRRTVRRAGRTIDLQPREFLILEQLLRNADRVVTRTMLLDRVWDLGFDPRTNIVETHISRLRTKLNEGFDRDAIQTVRGSGYMIGTDAD